MDPTPLDALGSRAPIPSELAFKGIVTVAWRFYRRNLPALLRIALPPLALYSACTLLLASQLDLDESNIDDVGFTLLIFGQIIVHAVISSFIITWTARTIIARTMPPEAAPTWEVPPLVWRNVFAASLISAMLAVAFFATGLVFLRDPFLGPPIVAHVIVLEGVTLYAAWNRARKLLAGQWLRIFMYLLTAFLGLALLTSIVLALVGGALGEAPDDFEWGYASIVALTNTITEAFRLPFLGAVALACYLDLRVRAGELEPEGSPTDQAGLTGP